MPDTTMAGAALKTRAAVDKAAAVATAAAAASCAAAFGAAAACAAAMSASLAAIVTAFSVATARASMAVAAAAAADVVAAVVADSILRGDILKTAATFSTFGCLRHFFLLLQVLVDAVISTWPCTLAFSVSPFAKPGRNDNAVGTWDGRPFPLFAAVTGILCVATTIIFIIWQELLISKHHLIFTLNDKVAVAIRDSQYFSTNKLLSEFPASASKSSPIASIAT